LICPWTVTLSVCWQSVSLRLNIDDDLGPR
jgi:hypothetical protein